MGVDIGWGVIDEGRNKTHFKTDKGHLYAIKQ